MGNTAGLGFASTIFSGADTRKTYEPLAEDTRNDLCLRVVCEFFSV